MKTKQFALVRGGKFLVKGVRFFLSFPLFTFLKMELEYVDMSRRKDKACQANLSDTLILDLTQDLESDAMHLERQFRGRTFFLKLSGNFSAS